MKRELTIVAVWMTTALGSSSGAAAQLSELGQSAFSALTEAAATLDADERTDWRRVNLLALREHLVDMNEVVLRAEVEEQPIEGGVRVHLTGSGRTLEALRRMIPQHTHMMRRMEKAEALSITETALRELPNGYELDLRVRTHDPLEVERLRALGFFGFLTAGDHHRHHHWGIVSGAMHHPTAPEQTPGHSSGQ